MDENNDDENEMSTEPVLSKENELSKEPEPSKEYSLDKEPELYDEYESKEYIGSAPYLTTESGGSDDLEYVRQTSSFFFDKDDFDESEEQISEHKLTARHIREVQYELGKIILAWPPIFNVEFEGKKFFPEKYTKNSEKEKLSLLYAENFRRQFIHMFPNRRPLLLAADNECGLQVFFYNKS